LKLKLKLFLFSIFSNFFVLKKKLTGSLENFLCHNIHKKIIMKQKKQLHYILLLDIEKSLSAIFFRNLTIFCIL